MSFATQQIELSMCSPQTGLPLTANVYTIEGVTEDGAPRLMSIGQLVMAICLQRASALEDQIVDVMDEINLNTMRLNALSDAETLLVATGVDENFNMDQKITYYGREVSVYDFLRGMFGAAHLPTRHEISGTGGQVNYVWYYDEVQEVISLVEDKMDSLNTISQDTLIQLQSLTTKRDQTYDLVSNVLKSLNNVLVGNANNL